MKKSSSQKKLHLGKVKVAALGGAVQAAANAATANTCSVLCTWRICADNTSQGAPICSIDSCRF
ncbi:hypothetical protein [Chitinophaga sp. CB10]|uniref:hypothetical protein n=1 Tax=Chitinophaga sp. CB10 TaxID=1891659 RepID=UPI0025BD3A0E|nr:hypothetical protein [Chitinophaga sp. CB10]